jgi:methionyl-tRNA synthetase
MDPMITYDDFKKLHMQIGTVKLVEPVEGADKLLRCEIDFGEKDDQGHAVLRQIVSGIREYYPEYEKLVGKQLLYVTNLEPREIRGVTSNGMLMAVDGPDGKPVFLVPETLVTSGTLVR